mgnify:CR=1 FL=1
MNTGDSITDGKDRQNEKHMETAQQLHEPRIETAAVFYLVVGVLLPFTVVASVLFIKTRTEMKKPGSRKIYAREPMPSRPRWMSCSIMYSWYPTNLPTTWRWRSSWERITAAGPSKSSGISMNSITTFED